ncbi:hypothetical protein [Halocella sp. SP3-1]|uniref:LysM peptidoglycan-binding domain-containing protein n=1 Tax=Halocella sp. SP3-1 TaxID=2382161 RepID=UPI000F7502F8|nr:hypothetical protein [Halocella sp. SP3-1]AZO94100.1 hypothetical protein D7D81_05550 [Halocella sp. SP3-1]
MSNEESKITHKELLTFTNLTNLQWEFVNLEAIKEGRRVGEDSEQVQSTQLNDLLTPKVFVEGYKDPETKKEPIYAYGEGEEGIIKLRRNAGIAMEYLEKIGTDNKEGDFLQDWEVIYGGDNYQVVADYINNKWSRLCQFLNSIDETLNLDETEKIDPGRESIEDIAGWKTGIRIGVTGLSLGLSYMGVNKKYTKMVKKVSLQETVKKFLSSVGKSAAQKSVENHAALALVMSIILYNNDPLKLAKKIVGRGEEEVLKRLSKELERNIPENIEGEEIIFDENLDMRDTGFRAVVFRKKVGNNQGKDQVVIAYKGGKKEDKHGFPQEFELLQIVYHKIRQANPEAEISFTGYNRGADLSFINALYADYRKVHTVEKGDNLTQIAQDKYGDASLWDERLEHPDGTVYQDRKIYPGDEVYYYDQTDKRKKAVLFYSSIEELKDYIQFTPDNIGQEYKPFRVVTISALGSGINDFASRILISTAVVMVKMARGASLASLGIRGLLFYNLQLAVITLIVSLIFESGQNYLKKLGYQEIHGTLKDLNLLEEKKDISPEGTGQEIIEGYITDDFCEKPYISLEVPYLDQKEKRFKREEVKIDKEIAIHIIKNRLIDFETTEYKAVTLRKGEEGEEEEDSIFINALSLGWIRLSKEDDIFKARSLVLSQGTHPSSNNPIAPADDGSGYKNSLTDLDDMEIVPVSQLKRQLIQLEGEYEQAGRETKADIYPEIREIEDKINSLKAYQGEIRAGQMMMAIMEIIADMQRNWERNREKIETLYWDLAAMYQGEQSITISNNVLKLAGTIKEKEEKDHTRNDYNGVTASEFGFMPYLKKENGNIAKENPVLREEYKASLFKTLVLYSKTNVQLDGSNPNNLVSQYMDDKFSLKDISANHRHLFGEKDKNQVFIQMMENIGEYIAWDMEGEKHVGFNHYESFLKEVQAQPELLEKYYQENEEDKDEWNPLGVLSRNKGSLTLNPKAAEKAVMEYKYNPNDFIRGGVMELTISKPLWDPTKVAFKETLDIKSFSRDNSTVQYFIKNTDIDMDCETRERVRIAKNIVNEKRINDDILI